MGRHEPPDHEVESDADLERRRRNLSRQIRLSSPEWVRDNIDRAVADRLGLIDLYNQKSD